MSEYVSVFYFVLLLWKFGILMRSISWTFTSLNTPKVFVSNFWYIKAFYTPLESWGKKVVCKRKASQKRIMLVMHFRNSSKYFSYHNLYVLKMSSEINFLKMIVMTMHYCRLYTACTKCRIEDRGMFTCSILGSIFAVLSSSRKSNKLVYIRYVIMATIMLPND